METIAITFWNGLVSPLFDAAAELLVVGPDGARWHVDMSNKALHAKADLLSDRTAGVLICGAISSAALALLRERGVRVIPWIRGPVDDVLKAYGNGILETAAFFMPGCRCQGGCRRRRRGSADGGRGQCRRPVRQVMDVNKLSKGKK